MSIENLDIPEVKLIRPRRFPDSRGWFIETYSRRELARAGIVGEFVQDNHSLSIRVGTIRGLHFQVPPQPQAKLVWVLVGSVFDVAVDLRRGSPTYGRWCGATLTAQGAEQIFVPRGFAHGFCTLAPDTEVAYKVDGYYAPDCNAGIHWADPDLAIGWPAEAGNPFLSDADAALPRLAGFVSPFVYEGSS
jgi:dTDP-4-dehydrorhamnose 3,5-epimerase